LSNPELFGLLAQLFTAASALPYIIGILRGVISPNPVSWGIWAFIGFIFLITSMTNPNADHVTIMFTAILAFNPFVIFILTLYKGIGEPITKLEIFALIIAFISITLWYVTQDKPTVLPIILAIFADLSALIPTIVFVYKHPDQDRPLMWSLFFLGASFTLLGIQSWNLESVLLPMYMASSVVIVIYPLVRYRVVNKLAIKEWV
jgi:hypothetical protein